MRCFSLCIILFGSQCDLQLWLHVLSNLNLNSIVQTTDVDIERMVNFGCVRSASVENVDMLAAVENDVESL
jgi:hypothetical protein